jgi:hypothetical protein
MSRSPAFSTLGFNCHGERGPKSRNDSPGARSVKVPRTFPSAWKSRWRNFRLWEAEENGIVHRLTLSGTQENFSEIIKGTPSIAVREKRH